MFLPILVSTPRNEVSFVIYTFRSGNILSRTFFQAAIRTPG